MTSAASMRANSCEQVMYAVHMRNRHSWLLRSANRRAVHRRGKGSAHVNFFVDCPCGCTKHRRTCRSIAGARQRHPLLLPARQVDALLANLCLVACMGCSARDT